MHRLGNEPMSMKLISIGEAASLLGISRDTLRRWDRTGRITSIRSGFRGHRYYQQSDIDLFLRNELMLAQQWATALVGVAPAPEVYCQTRDVFQARLEKFQSVVGSNVSLDMVSLISAVAGEIGNNSFDHNLGNWPDISGIFFAYDMRNKIVILADRGQGILKTLKRVKPELTTAAMALKVAFTETISGRSPEARGNGLKFVRSVIMDDPLTLYFQTGDACLHIKQHDTEVMTEQATPFIRGCFATIGFDKPV